MKKAPCGRNPTWGRAGVQLGAAGAAAAGARDAEDQEPRAGEERAQPGWGAASGANFSHRGSGEERERGSRTEGGGAGLSAGRLWGDRRSGPQLHPSWAALGRAEAAPGRWRPLAQAGLVPSAGPDRASRRHAGVELN